MLLTASLALAVAGGHELRRLAMSCLERIVAEPDRSTSLVNFPPSALQLWLLVMARAGMKKKGGGAKHLTETVPYGKRRLGTPSSCATIRSIMN